MSDIFWYLTVFSANNHVDKAHFRYQCWGQVFTDFVIIIPNFSRIFVYHEGTEPQFTPCFLQLISWPPFQFQLPTIHQLVVNSNCWKPQSKSVEMIRLKFWGLASNYHNGVVIYPFLRISWSRHQMETFSMLLATCAGNSPVPHKGQWCRACAWINGWVNNREAGDLTCHRAHYDVTVMDKVIYSLCISIHRNTIQILQFFRVPWASGKISQWTNQMKTVKKKLNYYNNDHFFPKK